MAFSVPADDPGILYIYGRQASDTRKLEASKVDVGNANYGGQEVIIIFEDTFVPYKNVYMLGEIDFTGMLVERFAGYHRQSYGGCKVGNGDVLIGASQTAAECNGCAKASHIKDKIIEMIHLNETLFSCGIACSCEGSPTRAGNYQIDMLLANVCKQNVTRLPYEIARLAQDIAGGLMVTMPSDADFHVRRSGRMVPQAHGGRCPVFRGRPPAHPPPHRGHDHRFRGGGLPHRIHARRRFAAGPAHHDRPSGQHGSRRRPLHAACAASIPTACSDLKTPAAAFGALAGHCLKRGKGVMYENILFEKKDGVAYLTLNRPDRLNALNGAVLKELDDALAAIDGDAEIRVLVVRGAGEKALAAGADITEMQSMEAEAGMAFGAFGQKVFAKIEALRQPSICMLPGFALGGGCELALACDIRIASEKARFGQPEVGLGITAGFGGTQRLPRLVGRGAASLLLFSGNMIDAAEALRIALSTRSSPTMPLPLKFPRWPKDRPSAPYAVQQTKRCIRHGPRIRPRIRPLVRSAGVRPLFLHEGAEGQDARLRQSPPLIGFRCATLGGWTEWKQRSGNALMRSLRGP